MPARVISSSVEVHVPNIPVHKIILEKLKSFGDRTCLIEYETKDEYKYSRLLNDSLRLAFALKKSNLNPGEIFMVYGFNCYEYVVALIAGLFVGGVALPLRGADTTSEFHKELESKDVRLLFIDAKLRDVAVSVKKQSDQIKDVILFDGVKSDSDLKCIRSLVKDNCPLNENDIYDPQGNQQSIAIILESSGTTGATKGAQLAHYDLATTFVVKNPFPESMESQITLGASPMAHLSGLMSLFFTIREGASIVTLRNNTLESNIGAIEECKVTRCIFSPSMIAQLVKCERAIDFNSVQSVFCGGSRLPKGLGDEFVRKFNIPEFRNAYTMTEITVLTTMGENEMGHFESIGKICEGIKIKVVDPETGKLLGENETGEICVKAPFTFKGYYKNEKITKDLLDSEGYIKTGDIGYFDENEEFFLVDRIKDIIKQNGFGYSPVDIEEILLEHDAVEEAAVVGIPDPEAGDLSHAFVILRNRVEKDSFDKQQLIDFVNEKVSKLKQLKGDIHLVSELPKTHFGKIIRRKLRDEYLNNNLS